MTILGHGVNDRLRDVQRGPAPVRSVAHLLVVSVDPLFRMLFALVVMAGVVLLVAVVNNRREPSRWDSRLPQRRAAGSSTTLLDPLNRSINRE